MKNLEGMIPPLKMGACGPWNETRGWCYATLVFAYGVGVWQLYIV